MHISVLAVLLSGGFLVIAVRWLLALRRESQRAKLPLTNVDKVVAAAPIAYSVFCIFAGSALLEHAFELHVLGGTTDLPILGAVDERAALFTLWLLAGLAVASPLIVISTAETYFAAKLPDLVRLGRQAVFETLTGVRVPPPKAEDKWHELLQR